MLKKALGQLIWLPDYLLHRIFRNCRSARISKVFFCICDHFEPYWGNASAKIAGKRIQTWVDNYPLIAADYPDSDGRRLKYSFFYPIEQYVKSDLDLLQKLVADAHGEVEIHLHHHRDTASNLKKCLTDYKKRLYNDHGMLSADNRNQDIGYGFIHGNWALDNSNPQGNHCGVNNEIDILSETGCYADFTLPSAPDPSQTRKVNSIYRAVDDPQRPKSHDTGKDIRVGDRDERGLLMVQGPLMLNWKKKGLAIFPGIENSGLYETAPPGGNRLRLWTKAQIHVKGMPQWIFIKLYTHGAHPGVCEMLFKNNGLRNLLSMVDRLKLKGLDLHFVSARELVNIVLALQYNQTKYHPGLRDFRFVQP